MLRFSGYKKYSELIIDIFVSFCSCSIKFYEGLMLFSDLSWHSWNQNINFMYDTILNTKQEQYLKNFIPGKLYLKKTLGLP